MGARTSTSAWSTPTRRGEASLKGGERRYRNAYLVDEVHFGRPGRAKHEALARLEEEESEPLESIDFIAEPSEKGTQS